MAESGNQLKLNTMTKNKNINYHTYLGEEERPEINYGFIGKFFVVMTIVLFIIWLIQNYL